MTDAVPAVGDLAPDFTLLDAAGREVSLSQFAGRPVIVYFYPAAMTPGCTTEACDFTAAKPALDTAGDTVIGISPDPPTKLSPVHGQFSPYLVLLSDPARVVLTGYGAFGEKKHTARRCRA